MSRSLLAICSILLTPVFLLAQPLAEHIPTDAIVYVGWQGSQSMPPAYADSHLKGVLDASNLTPLLSGLLPRAAQHLSSQHPKIARIIEILTTSGSPLWRHPSALYVTGFDFKAPTGVRPRFAILCQAGDEADALLAQFQSLADLGTPFPIRTFKTDQLVVLTSDDLPASPKPLSANPAFQQAMSQVQKDAILLAYIDAEAFLAQANEAAATFNAPSNWSKLRDALGLATFKRLILTGGFDGRDWSTQAFIAMPASRQGLGSLLESKPISEATLKLIPQAATFARVDQLDLAGLLDIARSIVGQIDPMNQTALDDAVTQVNQMFGFDLRKDVLEAFHNEWTFYTNPTAADRAGFVLINRLNKPVEAERTLNQFEQFAGRLIAGLLKESGATLAQNKIGPLTVHTITARQMAPSWTIANSHLFLTLSPQSLPAVVDSTGKGKSILENPAFLSLRTRLGGQNAISFDFTDLPKTAPMIYPTLQQLSQLGIRLVDDHPSLDGPSSPASRAGPSSMPQSMTSSIYQRSSPASRAGPSPAPVLPRQSNDNVQLAKETPADLLPPLHRLAEHLTPAMGLSWTDEAGWHYRSLSPFPGSLLLSPSGITLAKGSSNLAILYLDWTR